MPDYWLLTAWVGLLIVNVLLSMRLARIYGWGEVLWGYFTAVYTVAVPLIASAYTLKLIWMCIPEWCRFPLFISLWIGYGAVCIYTHELMEKRRVKNRNKATPKVKQKRNALGIH